MKAYHINNPLKILISLSLLFLFSNCSQSVSVMADNPLNSTYAYSNNININYEIIGNGEKKIVFLHGFGSSLHTWDDIKYMFPEEEFTLYLIDLKGFGNSSKPEDDLYTIQDQAKIVKQFVKDINTDSLYLIGHSFGGAVALVTQSALLNEKSKTKISKLILIGCLAYKQEMPVFAEYLRTPVINELTFLLPNKYRAEYVLNKIFYNKNLVEENLIDRYSSYYEADGINYTFITSARQMDQFEYEKIISDYKSIPTPCLIIWGKNDSILPMESGIKLSRELPNARLEIIDECGHTPQEEKPELTFEKIYLFIKE
ncbi:MAG: hypothetical protein CVV24_11920 [Ignavibacteriae bacterium HGW-Ignavibacteriae-3]|nr:MAG: hypothetical protein CVV24_11920 [Ignavibacteriae bacterium HGW-Ignavibacteriae-3]